VNEIQTLIKLQEIDGQLYELERSKGDLPRRVEDLEARKNQLAADYQKKTSELSAVISEKRSAEGALEMLRERRKKFESQLYAVTTNREYDAVTVEIESAEMEIDNRETLLLQLFDREKALNNDLESLNGQIAEVTKEYDEQRALLDARLAETRTTVEALQGQRNAHTAHLKPQVLSNYSRILRGKDGVAVVAVVRGSCGGCSTRIPPQRGMEIREMDRIILCESCGRILVPMMEPSAEIST